MSAHSAPAIEAFNPEPGPVSEGQGVQPLMLAMVPQQVTRKPLTFVTPKGEVKTGDWEGIEELKQGVCVSLILLAINCANNVRVTSVYDC